MPSISAPQFVRFENDFNCSHVTHNTYDMADAIFNGFLGGEESTSSRVYRWREVSNEINLVDLGKATWTRILGFDYFLCIPL